MCQIQVVAEMKKVLLENLGELLFIIRLYFLCIQINN